MMLKNNNIACMNPIWPQNSMFALDGLRVTDCAHEPSNQLKQKVWIIKLFEISSLPLETNVL